MLKEKIGDKATLSLYVDISFFQLMVIGQVGRLIAHAINLVVLLDKSKHVSAITLHPKMVENNALVIELNQENALSNRVQV